MRNNRQIKKKIKQVNNKKKKQNMINERLREGINKIINK